MGDSGMTEEPKREVREALREALWNAHKAGLRDDYRQALRDFLARSALPRRSK